MAGGNTIHGNRVSVGPMGEAKRGNAAPGLHVSYYCTSGREARPAFAADAVIPKSWDCSRCGLPVNTDAGNSPPPPKIAPYKTHLTYVKGYRVDTEVAQILKEAMSSLRARQAAGEILY